MTQKKGDVLGQVIDGRWTILRKLKEGGFGSVYVAREGKTEYAVKLMPLAARRYADIECRLYELMQKEKFTLGFVKHYKHGELDGNKYLAMELLGKDLQEIRSKSEGKRLSIKSVLMVGLQAIDRLEALHKIGYLHRDIKPDNFAIGLKEKQKIIYLIDFGLALPLNSPPPAEEKGKAIGTLGFMSCRAHEGKGVGPADDLQALIYTLLYLVEGALPWMHLRIQSPADFHKILLMKRSLTRSSLKSSERLPPQLFELLAQLRSIPATGKVDYLQAKYQLLEALKTVQARNDFQFDWCLKESKHSTSRSPRNSPRRQRMEIMNEQNQLLVQNEIYEVYKFMGGEQPKKGKSPPKTAPQKQRLKKVEQRKEEQIKKPKEKEVRKQQPRRVRPESAASKKAPVWEQFAKLQVSGPRIVINKTAKHKI